MPLPVFFLWLFLVWASGWLAYPWARRVWGHSLPDGGLACGRIGFSVVWGLVAFWLGRIGVSVALSAWLYVVLAGVGLWGWGRDRAVLQSELRTRRRALLSVEAVFLCTFFVFFALRGYWSDTNGNNGEKSMDSALIGTLMRAQKLPPENPYAAGARLDSYYIFGHLESALFTHLTHTTVRWSYNLVCATLPALCFSALFSLGAGLTRRLDGGVFVSCTILGLGTLQPLYQWFKPDGLLRQPNAHLVKNLDFFAVSRPLPNAINEFPWFTFNQSDLHAHYFDFPIEIALMSLAWAIFRARSERQRRGLLWVAALFLGAQILTNTWDFPAYSLLVALALFLSPRGEGAQKQVLTQAPKQSTPPISPLTSEKKKGKQAAPQKAPQAVAVAPVQKDSSTDSSNGGRALSFGVTIVVALALASPYLLGINTAARGPSPLPQPASPLREWLLLWAPILVAWMAFCAWATFRFDRRWRWTIGIISLVVALAAVFGQSQWGYPAGLDAQPQPSDEALREWLAPLNPARLVLPIIAWTFFLSVLGAYFNRGVTRFLPCLAIAGLFSVLWSETTWAGFLGDPKYLAFADYKRQDTVFKFGLQAWFLWGTAAAAGAYLTLKRWPLALRLAFIPFLLVMALSSFVDTLGRTRNFAESEPRQNWDGWAHMKPAEQEAATWLEEHTAPDQNILEAEEKEGGDYSVYTRYTHATGIATIIGPQSHSFQWSPNPERAKLTEKDIENNTTLLDRKLSLQWEEVGRRKEDARKAFTTKNSVERLAILKKYKVRYVVWGELERTQYGQQSYDLLRNDLKPVAHFDSSKDPDHAVEIFEVPSTSR